MPPICAPLILECVRRIGNDAHRTLFINGGDIVRPDILDIDDIAPQKHVGATTSDVESDISDTESETALEGSRCRFNLTDYEGE